MENKNIALVTGASKGIGLAITKRLIIEGFFVVMADIDENKEMRNHENTSFIKTNVAQEEDVKTLFNTIKARFKKLDLLVNNAGIVRDNLIGNMPLADFNLVLDINLKGVWMMCKEASELMKENNKGRIVNITSRAWLGNRGQTNYSASKAGVVGLTRALALELGKYNILVNAIAPGLIDTPLTQALRKDVLDKLIAAQPTKTMGLPDDIANAVAFLGSYQTQFITGQTLYVDGGKSIGSNM
ncbi:3-oxoacyl-[acyl-carrier protein] reductase [Flavobacteriales bacterium]|nr:putative oxidoreductase [Flavobacteriales bacterium]MCL4815303.1 SDR family oxidoreductase [Flavobacteriales bacterium]WKZ74919.1 MAG: SDR family NAD(P)-dependent oxidoreductase [Vicingaceae bacterium]GIK69862.1 MAG: 3-oxoacyl-ACP reductase [Bacteroidota bacterium]CAG0961494.1 3-oxoacyl-[acyl-carrier protein] reductase [Flavobacteriales bacterium]